MREPLEEDGPVKNETVFLSRVISVKHLKIAVAVLGLFASTASFADQGDIIARVRAISIRPDVHTSGTLSTLGTSVNEATVPEIDFTYMVRKHIGVELILGTSRHKVTSNAGSLGGLSVLPPTLTAQWHFNPDGRVRPYVGAGINYSWFYNDKLTYGGEGVGVKHSSFGPALQIGVDVQVSKRIFVNLDLKKLWMRTDPTLGGASLGTLKIDPWVIGVGVGTTF